MQFTLFGATLILELCYFLLLLLLLKFQLSRLWQQQRQQQQKIYFFLHNRSERCLFLSVTEHAEIFFVRKSSRISLPLFWIRVYYQDIFKTIKGTNRCIEATEHSSSDICWRYYSDGKDIIIENFNKQKQIDFSASTSGFCNKSENISSETMPNKYGF